MFAFSFGGMYAVPTAAQSSAANTMFVNRSELGYVTHNVEDVHMPDISWRSTREGIAPSSRRIRQMESSLKSKNPTGTAAAAAAASPHFDIDCDALVHQYVARWFGLPLQASWWLSAGWLCFGSHPIC